MSMNAVVVQGIVTPEGNLTLESKVSLPPGRVQVTVQPVPELPKGDPFFDLLKDIWETRAKAGLQPRTVGEIEEMRRQLREASALEVMQAMQMQEDGNRPNDQAQHSAEGPE